jgi:hypothetical protein
MNRNMLDRLGTALRVLNGTIDLGSHIPVNGYWDVKVIRADGSIEQRVLKNIVTASGLNRIANRAVVATGTPIYVLGVGTVTAAASLGSTNFGEVSGGRKAAATAIQSSEWIALTATWAGNTDGLTGIVLDSASMLCHASSGQGAVINMVNSLNTTLAASDFLNLTCRIRVGSHDLGHST